MSLCFQTATALRKAIQSKTVSVTEVMEAHLNQIDCVNPKVNAIVTLHAEEALEQAKAADKALAQGDAQGSLFGLPVAHKDLIETKDMRLSLIHI